ncbi:MAG TPA: RES domain-containing protein [Chthoniobacterales bacterium]|jgi:RES domain-containing protein|nr:RES domain-containing protein [Chthoniobacterales bacterium]
MKVADHPQFETLRQRLQEAPELLQPWSGAAYRVTTLDYPNPRSILLGQGSYLHGGRWNAPDSFRAVYGSTEDTVAVAESRATADYAHVPWPFRNPRLLVAIELSLQSVLDLGRAEVRRKLGLRAEELGAEDWRRLQEQGEESLTQAMGRAAFTEGGEGMLVPSARVRGGVNVVYFPENQRATSKVTVLESEKLDRVRLA